MTTYEIYPADQRRLDALKKSPSEAQADTMRRLLDRYLGGKPPEQVRERSQQAEARIAAGVKTLIAYNEAQNDPADRWAVTPRLIAQLTGCFAPTVKRYCEQHQAEITEHNAIHRLTPGTNVRHGKLGRTINRCLKSQMARLTPSCSASSASSDPKP